MRGIALAAAGVKATCERIASPPPGVVSARRSLFADLAGIDTPAERHRLRAERGDRLRFEETAQTGTLMLTVNTEREPFDDLRVRRAPAMAIDHWGGEEPMGRLTIFGIAGGFLRPGDPIARTKAELATLPGFAADMAAARAEARHLLAEAGHPNLAFTFTNRPRYTPIGILLIDQWRQIGVSVKHKQPDNAAFFAARATTSRARSTASSTRSTTARLRPSIPPSGETSRRRSSSGCSSRPLRCRSSGAGGSSRSRARCAAGALNARPAPRGPRRLARGLLHLRPGGGPFGRRPMHRR